MFNRIFSQIICGRIVYMCKNISLHRWGEKNPFVIHDYRETQWPLSVKHRNGF